MKWVIDTNITIAANGNSSHASPECQLACIEILEEACAGNKGLKIILDDLDLIFSEYSRHLSYKGQPGVGDMYFKFLHNNKHLEKSINLVTITPNESDESGFDELPNTTIDKSDRKFLAAAIIGNAAIVNALDTDWHEQRDFLERIGVAVIQICSSHGCATN